MWLTKIFYQLVLFGNLVFHFIVTLNWMCIKMCNFLKIMLIPPFLAKFFLLSLPFLCLGNNSVSAFWRRIMVGPPSEYDLLNIVNAWYPKLNPLAGKLIGNYFLVFRNQLLFWGEILRIHL